MPSTYTTNLGIEKIATGEQSGTWGNTTNTNLDILDQSIDGIISITLISAGSSGSPNSLPITDGAVSNGRNKFIEFVDGGDLGATAYVQLTPNDAEKIVHIRNSLSASRSIIVFQGTYNASNDYEILNGEDVLLKFDGAGAGAVVSQVFANLALPSVNIDGGTIDGAVIGGATAAAGSFTTLSASSPISAADGSAAAPSLSFTDDIDTGFYRAGANSIGVVLGGTEELTLNSTKASVLDALGSVMSSTATAAAQRAALGVGTSWTLIESQTASTSASLDFTTGIDSTYDLYALVITNLRPATDGANLHLRMALSGSFRSTAGDYEYNNIVLLSSIAGVTSHGNSQGAVQIQCALGISNVATEAANGVIYFSAPSSSTHHKAWGDLNYMDNSATALFSRAIFGGVLNGTSAAIDGVQLLMSSGNITSATVALYGLRK